MTKPSRTGQAAEKTSSASPTTGSARVELFRTATPASEAIDAMAPVISQKPSDARERMGFSTEAITDQSIGMTWIRLVMTESGRCEIVPCSRAAVAAAGTGEKDDCGQPGENAAGGGGGWWRPGGDAFVGEADFRCRRRGGLEPAGLPGHDMEKSGRPQPARVIGIGVGQLRHRLVLVVSRGTQARRRRSMHSGLPGRWPPVSAEASGRGVP